MMPTDTMYSRTMYSGTTLFWTQELATGERSIDLQHQDLIDMINDLGRALADKAAPAALRGILQRLNQYVLFHFAHEEALMRSHRVAVAHMEQHMDSHADFASKVTNGMQVLDDNAADSLQRCQGLLNYLVAWLTEHIMRTDKELALLLRQPRANVARGDMTRAPHTLATDGAAQE